MNSRRAVLIRMIRRRPYNEMIVYNEDRSRPQIALEQQKQDGNAAKEGRINKWGCVEMIGSRLQNET
jgi:hypothetical protein